VERALLELCGILKSRFRENVAVLSTRPVDFVKAEWVDIVFAAASKYWMRGMDKRRSR
jgi:hypothetical protein